MSNMAKVISKASNDSKKVQIKKNTYKRVKPAEPSLDDVLIFGGTVSKNFIIQDKVRKIALSVDNGQRANKNVPNYKFHIRTALGYRLFIQAKSRSEAQDVVNQIFGKNHYTVSGTDV